MGLGGPPGPHMSEIDAYIYQMGQQMRPGHGRTQARSMTLAGNYVPHVAYPSSSYNPTSGPRMNESRSDMVNHHGLTLPTEYRSNSSTGRPSSLASELTSSFISPPGPSFSVDPNSDRTREDRSVHRTNIGSFNENNDTVRGSYNDNSLADTTGRYSGHGNVLFHDILIVN